MSDMENLTLNLVQQALSQYVDVPVERMTLDAQLQDLQIDSLTLAELLFEIEDRLNVELAETDVIPKTVGDLVRLVQPHIDPDQFKSAA
ncbi:MAG: acyl carrier protein [Burkholderiales bacterium]|nr:acyl carrier protein [Burkholderiales bacterium]